MLLMLGESRICIVAPRRRRLRLLLRPRQRIQRASAGAAAGREIQRRHDGSPGQEEGEEDAAAGPAGSGIGVRGEATAIRQAIDPRSSQGGRVS